MAVTAAVALEADAEVMATVTASAALVEEAARGDMIRNDEAEYLIRKEDCLIRNDEADGCAEAWHGDCALNRFCITCGHPLPTVANFCPICGAKRVVVGVTPVAVEPPQSASTALSTAPTTALNTALNTALLSHAACTAPGYSLAASTAPGYSHAASTAPGYAVTDGCEDGYEDSYEASEARAVLTPMDEYLRMSRGSMMSMMSSEKSPDKDEYLRMSRGTSAVPSGMSAVPSGLSVPARGFFDVAPTRHAKSLAILGNPAEFDAKSLAGTLIATDDLPCMQVLTTALPDGSLPEDGPTGTASFFDVQRRQFFDAEERRIAPDAKAYTKPEFRRWYGGYQEWDCAAPATHWSDSKGYYLPN
eukprot:jgi/Chrpa1/18425/Chrysochromulina_OHIO_Genome00023810-RA